ncbi:MAG: class II aldolase/adducin family protein [Anaerolineae bacterium]
MSYLDLRGQVLATARAMLQAGLTVGNSGNVSARVPGADRLLVAITPHGAYYDTLDDEDIVVVDAEGEPVAGDGLPSVELGLHAAVYAARPDVGAIVHAHPPMASAAAVIGRPIPPILEDQMIYLGGQIEVAAAALSGSTELSANALAALGRRNACLLGNHGALAVGRDLREALCACQYLEKVAQAFVYASLAGSVTQLPAAMIEATSVFFRGH